jgi:hypothetical protein
MRCGADAPGFALADLGGAGFGIVVTQDCDDATVGTAMWNVHSAVCGR